jgi:exopolysaccharide biosynthesis protein
MPCRLLILLFCWGLTQSGIAQDKATDWFDQRPFTPHLVWGYPSVDSMYGTPQFIQYLKFGQEEYHFDLAWVNDTLVRTSDLAQRQESTAAINGGFFDMKAGGSVTYLRADGQTINDNGASLVEQKNEILEGAVVINKQGRLRIRRGRRIQRKKRYEDVLVTGPLLLYRGQPDPLVDRSFNNDRHPRSCLCTDDQNNVYFITVDGRHEQAAGMSLHELTRLVQDLGCTNAINLDGGGSTTLYIRNQGVINHPSDNRQFDAKGERPCANAILAIRR